MTRYRFAVPPDWPPLPSKSWTPPEGWAPAPDWPTPPQDWQFWVVDPNGAATPPLWPRSTEAADRRRAVVSLGCAVVDLILLTTAAMWAVVTSASGHPLWGQAEFLIFLGPVFPLFGYAVFLLRVADRRRRRPSSWTEPSLGEMVRALSHRARAFLGLGVAALGTVLTASLVSGTLVPPNGQPTYNSALRRYQIDDHGSVTVVSKAVYDHGSIAGAHLFTVVACVFLLLALLVQLGRWCWHHHVVAAV